MKLKRSVSLEKFLCHYPPVCLFLYIYHRKMSLQCKTAKSIHYNLLKLSMKIYYFLQDESCDTQNCTQKRGKSQKRWRPVCRPEILLPCQTQYTRTTLSFGYKSEVSICLRSFWVVLGSWYWQWNKMFWFTKWQAQYLCVSIPLALIIYRN